MLPGPRRGACARPTSLVGTEAAAARRSLSVPAGPGLGFRQEAAVLAAPWELWAHRERELAQNPALVRLRVAGRSLVARRSWSRGGRWSRCGPGGSRGGGLGCALLLGRCRGWLVSTGRGSGRRGAGSCRCEVVPGRRWYRSRGRTDQRRVNLGAGRVAPSQRQHLGQVGAGVVVGQHRALLPGRAVQITGSHAQIVRRGQSGVVDVERARGAVTVAVDGVTNPGTGDELHRPDRPVIDRVTVIPTMVGVVDERKALAVQRRPDDLRGGSAVRAQRRAAELPVVRLHPADRGHQRPIDTATAAKR